MPKTLLKKAGFLFLLVITSAAAVETSSLRLHNIFADHMVVQRDKPIRIWGFADPGKTIHVKFGEETAQSQVVAGDPINVFGMEEEYAGLGRWEVTLSPREASAEPDVLQVTDRDKMIEIKDILIGDVWVMHGQSNMAFPAGKTNASDLIPQANLPLLRFFSIQTNEQATLQDDIRPEAITTDGGWVVSSPETAREFSAIGYVFGLNVQRTVGIPIGLIKTARGGASIESMVPVRKFDEHPLAKRYADHVKAQMAAFDPEAEADRMWEIQKKRAKRKNKPEPERPDPNNLRSWNVPGKSPSDMGSVHNGFVGVFQGFNIKGLVFHQGYNNTIGTPRPKRYRVLMKLMVEGIREDFEDPELPVAVIGFCADGKASQGPHNFEARATAVAPFIRESQRLGLADVGDPENTIFIPAYDVQSQGLHPKRKREHGWRTARWALSEVYNVPGVSWRDPIKLISAETHGDVMVLGFDMRVQPKGGGMSVPQGFSIAGEDGKFYMAHARHAEYGKKHMWTHGDRSIQVWSPMVEKPVAVRYGWGVAPMGNLYFDGEQDQPFPSFRTDEWDYPETENPDEKPDYDWKRAEAEGEARVRERRIKEASMGETFVDRLDKLSVPIVPLEDAVQKGSK